MECFQVDQSTHCFEECRSLEHAQHKTASVQQRYSSLSARKFQIFCPGMCTDWITTAEILHRPFSFLVSAIKATLPHSLLPWTCSLLYYSLSLVFMVCFIEYVCQSISILIYFVLFQNRLLILGKVFHQSYVSIAWNGIGTGILSERFAC